MTDRSPAWLGLPTVDLSDEPRWLDILQSWLVAIEDSGIDLVVFGGFRQSGRPCDSFPIVSALASESGSLAVGVRVRPGSGRAASMIARELTTLDHMANAGTGLLIDGGSDEQVVEALAVISALLGDERATVIGDHEVVLDAPNLPGPKTPGGPPLMILTGEPGARTGSLRATGTSMTSLAVDVVEGPLAPLSSVLGTPLAEGQPRVFITEADVLTLTDLASLT